MPPPRKKRVAQTAVKGNPKIFLVHGQNAGVRGKVARFLEKLGCKPLILHELPNNGKHIFQKFSDHSAVEFAVVLLTGDDIGGRRRSKLHKRARQNVILELGFFLGKLGTDKVCSLYEEGVELPSDYAGILYIPLKKDEKWKRDLVREMKSVGISSEQLS
jgi:predicted nucleotide-binding protein